jgi:ferredoxin-NADP reductase
MTQMLEALVFAMRHEAIGIVSIELRPASTGQRFPASEAGAHIDLHLADGLVRSYSLCRIDPDDRQRYIIAVLNDRASRGGSRYVHEKLRVGSLLRISPPRNHFKLLEDAPKIVLIAGGIGITPIYAMLQRLSQLHRAPRVIYCARTRAEAAFVQGVEAYAGAGRVRWHFDDQVGRPPDLKEMLAEFDRDTHFYCCGPTPMLDAYEQACAKLGFEYVHLERFAPRTRETKPQDGGAFEVALKRTGLTLSVPPDKSILRVLLEAGVEADYSCEEGVCGSCETRVLEGDVDHRDCVLSAAERSANKSLMICVSRCKSPRLVLDK